MREAVGEGGDQRAVAQIAQRRGRNGVEQLAPFEHRRLAGLDYMLRPAHRRRRVGRQHLPGDQPVEQHPHGSELLLDAGRRANTSPASTRARARARVGDGNQRPWPADKVERWAIDRLIPYAKNARTHTDAQVAAIAASIKEWG